MSKDTKTAIKNNYIVHFTGGLSRLVEKSIAEEIIDKIKSDGDCIIKMNKSGELDYFIEVSKIYFIEMDKQ